MSKSMRRNPYLQDYEDQRRLSEMGRRKQEMWARTSAGAARRRRIVRKQRIAFGLCGLSILVLVMVLIIGKSSSSASNSNNRNQPERGRGSESAVNSVSVQERLIQGLPETVYDTHPDWTEDFLTPNEYSRPGDPLKRIVNIFVHYTANPGTSAAQNRSYFEQQKDVHERSVSSHFIIGYEGEILQCVPLDEIAYAVKTRNEDSISIECCYLDKTEGSFTQETYDSLIKLLAWLTKAYDLETDDILRHYDCGGKKCPLYYTEHPDAWEQLKRDVADAMEDSEI